MTDEIQETASPSQSVTKSHQVCWLGRLGLPSKTVATWCGWCGVWGGGWVGGSCTCWIVCRPSALHNHNVLETPHVCVGVAIHVSVLM